MKRGFTLIELLIVVLIIAILAAIALPYYRKAAERARMAEAVTILRDIASANQRYYLATGQYARKGDIEKLDIKIPGELSNGMVLTKDFMYEIHWTEGNTQVIAYAQRAPYFERYNLRIWATNPTKITCGAYTTILPYQKELCDEMDTL